MRSYLRNLVELPQVKEIFYILGSIILLFSAYAFGNAKEWVPTYFIVLTILFLIVRIVHCFIIYEECYLYEFCYCALAMEIVYLLFFPKSYHMELIFLGFTNGLQLWAALLNRNGMIPHRIDKIVTLFYHNIPSCIGYLIRTDTTGRYYKLDMKEGVLNDYLVYTVLAYICWLIFYTLAQNVIFKDYIAKHKLSSLIDYMLTLNESVGKCFMRYEGIQRSILYLFCHIMVFIPTTLISLISLYSINFHWWMCVISIMYSAFEGALYYNKQLIPSCK